MNENVLPEGPDDVSAPATADEGAHAGQAIVLPPANSDQGAIIPPAPVLPDTLAPTGPTPTVGSGWETPPAGNPPYATPPAGSPPYATPPAGTPAGGVWTPPPGSGWTPGPPAGPSKKHTGLVVGAGAVVLVAAVLGGVGLGHAVWPNQPIATASAPASNGSGGSSSAGGSTSPFGGSSSGSSGGTFSPFGGSSSSGSSGNSSTGAGAPSDISAIAAKVSPGLVDINTNLSYQDEQAAGTGMVLTSNGEILTNNHVIDGATSISVTDVGNGKTYNANVVGYDRTGDIAVIQLVNASGLQTVTTYSGAAAVGQAVVGVGNAGGTGGTPSAAGGSVTALNQSITASDDGGGNSENLTGLIEVNAGIEPGDSGGSLVDSSGRVLGMDTAASANSGDGSSATQAYAIPIGTALSVAKQIEAGNASSTIHIGTTGFLGVSVQDASGSGSSSGSGGFGFGGSSVGSGSTGSGSTTSGATVESTVSGSAAGAAGVVAGDVITALNGKAITSATDLSNALESHHPGDTVQLTWTDTSGQSHTAAVKLASGPPA